MRSWREIESLLVEAFTAEGHSPYVLVGHMENRDNQLVNVGDPEGGDWAIDADEYCKEDRINLTSIAKRLAERL